MLFALPPRDPAAVADNPNRTHRARAGLARASVIICASLLSVYFAYAIAAKAARPVSAPDSKTPSPNQVKVLDEPADLDNDATTRPTTAPAPDAPQGLPLSPSAMQVNPDGTFTLNITKDADLVETLRVIGFQAQKSMVPSNQVHGVLPALDLYNVTVHEALDAILRVNGFAYKEEGNFIYVYSQKELNDLEKANRAPETRLFRLHYTPAANAMVLVKPALSEKGEIAVSVPAVTGIDTGSAANITGSGGGGATASGGTGGDSHSTEDILVVKDFPENLDAVGKILHEIDTRPQQILVEATILQATLTENNTFGVNLTAFDGVDFSTLNNTITGGTTGTQGSAVNDALTGQIIHDSTSGPITDKGYVGGSISGQNGLQFAVVANNIGLFINALEGVTDTVILANPKILALNKQMGEVLVGEEDGYITTTVSSTTSTQTVDFLQTGTSLSFRPYIGDDGYIRMEIHPEDSSGGIKNQGGQNLPSKSTTEVTSNIMVKDGHTIVIGGLFRESNTTNKSQVPVMGNLPLIGSLFGQTTDATERKEIIILLTPHIIKDDAAYSAASEEEKKNAEKIRVGSRKEMMFTGRERLAECAYEQAVAEMHKPNPDREKALWYLDSATNSNPKFLEAIQLKEELNGKVVSDVDNSSIRSFVARQILAEKDLPERSHPVEVPITTSSAKPAPWEPSQTPTTRASFPTIREATLSDLAASSEVPPPGMTASQVAPYASATTNPATTAPAMSDRSVSFWDFDGMVDLIAQSCQRACDAFVRTTRQAMADAMNKPAPANKTTITELPADGN